MLPIDQVDLVAAASEWVPAWLGPQDHPWLDALLDELKRFEGRTVREWRARAAEPLRAPCSARRQRMVASLLEARCVAEPPTTRPLPRERRLALFLEAQRRRSALAFDRDAILSETAARLGMAPDALADALHSDVPSERRVSLASAPADAHALALEANLAMAQGLLRAAGSLEIDVGGGSRAVVRQILLKRLLCTVRPAAGGVRIEVSGPYALFRHTTLYGRALASIIPTLRGADRFVVRARLRAHGRPKTVRIASGDPVFPPGAALRRYDSQLEERFARDLARAAKDWDLVREPEPIAVDGTWVFPDFAIVHRSDPSRRWLLEVVGYWTPEYLESKLQRLRKAGRSDVIVCLDDRFVSQGMELPRCCPVVPFHRRIDVEAVRRILEEKAPQCPAAAPSRSVRERIGPADLFLDFAGRRPPEDPIHERLCRLRTGDRLDLVEADGWITLRNSDGEVVAALAGKARERWRTLLARIRRVSVAERIERRAAQSPLPYRAKLRVERWVVPVLEVELDAPASASSRGDLRPGLSQGSEGMGEGIGGSRRRERPGPMRNL
ncbi:MAG: DUF790 family protein [Deltaproteobacteria bacterium]|nr:DUF790 family protein [Deltaproteobacteria bacterium]